VDWDVKAWLEAKLQALCGFYFVDQASILPTKDDFLQTHPAQPPGVPGRLHARRMWPFGFRSIIPRGVEAVTVAPMGSQQKVIVGAESPSYGPTDLSVGDSAMYSSAHREGQVCVTKHAATGKITIDSKSDQDVQVNGGTLKVARVSDDVDCGLLRSQVVAVGAGVFAYTIFYRAPGGAFVTLLEFNALSTPVIPPVAGTVSIPIEGDITTGAERLKA
jgi:hypothetical protein